MKIRSEIKIVLMVILIVALAFGILFGTMYHLVSSSRITNTLEGCIIQVNDWHPGWVCSEHRICDGDNHCVVHGYELNPKPGTK